MGQYLRNDLKDSEPSESWEYGVWYRRVPLKFGEGYPFL